MAKAVNPQPTVATTDISWCPSWRIIPTQYPPVQFFEDISTSAEEWEALMEIEALTDDGIRLARGNLNLIPARDRISGPGAGWIMPCFLILDSSPEGSRFSNSQFGAYYAGKDIVTAIAETMYHRAKFMSQTAMPAQGADNAVLEADINAAMHDICGMQKTRPELYHPTDYRQSQAFAESLRARGSWGIVYDSVRNTEGQCVAVLRPPAISNCRQVKVLVYQWDGKKFTGYYEKTGYKSFGP